MEHPPPQEAAAQVWRAVLLTEQAHQATRAAAAAVAEHGQEYAHMRAEMEALAGQSAPAARTAQTLGHRYLSLSGEHAQEYARAAAARAFALAVEIDAVQAECDDDAPEDLDFQWHREQITAAGVMLACAAEWQRSTQYHQAQAGRAAAARVARLESDPDYAARVAARTRAGGSLPGVEPDDIGAEVEQAGASGQEPSAYAAELARIHDLTTRQGWDAYRPRQDPEAVADEQATTAPR